MADQATGDRHIAIVGGGVVGVATAYELARRGCRVTVIDDGELTTSASTGNAGIIALGHPPLPRPGLLLKTIGWMIDPASPLYVPFRIDLGLLSWMARFALACRAGPFERSVELMARMGLGSGERFQTIIADETIDCDYRPRGWMDVYRTDAAREASRVDGALLERAGYAVRELDAATIADEEPGLAGVMGATLYEGGGSIDPGPFLAGLAAASERRGATILRGQAVTGFERRDGRVVGVHAGTELIEADDVVLSAGAWSTALGRTIGVRIPMQAGKGYHVEVRTPEPLLRRVSVLSETHIAATPMGDRLRLAGTVELSGVNLRVHERRVRMLTEGARAYLPGIEDAEPFDAWCGLRPCTADGLPVIGLAPGYENLFIATGHAKMGLTLGPYTGLLLSQIVLGETPAMDVAAFSPARF